ncbi:MAG: class I SAM-dependent methyltransferase [Lysobacterales bacterium]
MTTDTSHPNGHFYSPVVDPESLLERKDTIWPAHPEVLGIDFNDEYHLTVLTEYFPRHFPKYDYPEHRLEGANDSAFYTQNSQFSWLDCRTLFVLLNEWRPSRYVEVGSGFSSLLAADINARYLDNACSVRCVEPYPREFLLKPIDGLSEVVQSKVELLPLKFFSELAAGDVLFIDSSHVSKTGSDVNYLVFEILPRLARGVKIHIHDLFFPHDYPSDWVLEENRSWNEQYLIRALLMYSNRFRVLFGCSYAHHKFPQQVASALNLPDGRAFAGGSLWLSVV